MNDAFAWDIGDLAKFALLRWLSPDGADRLSLGAVWCYTRTPPRAGQGRHIAYLGDGHWYGERIRQRDRTLYDLVRRGFQTGRSIRTAEYGALLPDDTVHVFDPFELEADGARPAYWRSALRLTAAADVVFFDPDNGIAEGASALSLSYQDLRAFYERGQSLVIYQHQDRKVGGIAALARDRVFGLQRHLGVKVVRVLRWHRYQARLFFVVPTPAHRQALAGRVRALLASPWGTLGWRDTADFSEVIVASA